VLALVVAADHKELVVVDGREDVRLRLPRKENRPAVFRGDRVTAVVGVVGEEE
jgi:hypothetical protein